MEKYNHIAADRFLQYVQIDTQSNAASDTCPSTLKQLNLSKLLLEQIKEMGIQDVVLDENGYVYATIPSNSNKQVPTLFFCSHVDTAPDCSGTNVKPVIHKNYQGGVLVLPDDVSQTLSIQNHPALQNQIGNDIVTASGLTLLGADDKAGIAEIMDAANYLITHPEIKHGTIKLFFTPDEEIGRGVNKANLQLLNADFGYTLDGGEVGDIEGETFSADGVTLVINGVSTHPGYALDKMENAMKIAGEILAKLPHNLSPEGTTGLQGFIHPVSVQGVLEKCEINFIIRDFNTEKLKEHTTILKNIVEMVMSKYTNSSYDFSTYEQYRNMKEILTNNTQVVKNAVDAATRLGIKVNENSIRGGTDGSRLSFMGLPCPNIFAGQHGIHSKQEWISIQDMNKAVMTIVEICKVWEEKA